MGPESSKQLQGETVEKQQEESSLSIEDLQGEEKEFASFLEAHKKEGFLLHSEEVKKALGDDKWQEIVKASSETYGAAYRQFMQVIPGERRIAIDTAIIKKIKSEDDLDKIENPVGKATLNFRNNNVVMVDLRNEAGEISGQSLFDLNEVSLTDKPTFKERVYIRPEELEDHEDEDYDNEESEYHNERYIIHTSQGDIGGKVISGRPGEPGIVQTPYGLIRVDKLE